MVFIRERREEASRRSQWLYLDAKCSDFVFVLAIILKIFKLGLPNGKRSFLVKHHHHHRRPQNPLPTRKQRKQIQVLGCHPCWKDTGHHHPRRRRSKLIMISRRRNRTKIQVRKRTQRKEKQYPLLLQNLPMQTSNIPTIERDRVASLLAMEAVAMVMRVDSNMRHRILPILAQFLITTTAT